MEILLAMGVFALGIALLSLGSVVFRRPLKGSCGGIMNAGGDGESCSICGQSTANCPNEK